MSAGGATTGLLALSRGLQERRRPRISLVALYSKSPDELSLFLWLVTPRRSATSITLPAVRHDREGLAAAGEVQYRSFLPPAAVTRAVDSTAHLSSTCYGLAPRIVPARPVFRRRSNRVPGPDRGHNRRGVGGPVFLPVDGPWAAWRLHNRTLVDAAEINGDKAGVVDQLADDGLRLGVVTADPLHDPRPAVTSRSLSLEAGGQGVEAFGVAGAGHAVGVVAGRGNAEVQHPSRDGRDGGVEARPARGGAVGRPRRSAQ